jgi:hypothetical protein
MADAHLNGSLNLPAALSTTFIPAVRGRTGMTERSGIVAVSAVTSGDKDRGQREEPAARQPVGDETGERSRLSDSIVGLFDRLREAAEQADGE